MVKMNFTDNQTAFEYSMYMMLGSYFNKATCSNAFLEKGMRVRYQEQKEKKQYEYEDLCIEFVEKKLLPRLPKKLWKQDVQVSFRPLNKAGLHQLLFTSKDYLLCITPIYKGKRDSHISYEVWAA